MSRILDRFDATSDGDGIRIDLHGPRNVLCTSLESGVASASSIGIGAKDCDVTLPGDPRLASSVKELEFGPTRCAAIAVADLNGGTPRAGSKDGGCRSSASVVVLIDADMSVSSMARAMVTATEAVTAAIQDLGLRDTAGRCGTGAASFSIAIVTDPDANLHLRNAGKHSKLGELIGRTVHDAVVESAKAGGLRRNTAGDAIAVLDGRGLDIEGMNSASARPGKARSGMLSDPVISAGISAILHLDDEIEWGLVPEDEGLEMEMRIATALFGSYGE